VKSTTRFPKIPSVVAAVLFPLAAWLAGIHLFGLPEYVLPTPSEVAANLAANVGYYAWQSLVTLLEAASGLAFAVTIGVVLGIISSNLPSLGNVVIALSGGLQTVPIVAISPLIVLWGGPGFVSKMIMAGVISFPSMAVASVQGFRDVPRELATSLTVMGTRGSQIFLSVTLPYAVRRISSGIQIAATLAVIGAIVAEYTGSLDGIGYVIMQSSYRSDIPAVFVAVILSILIGWFLVLSTAAVGALVRGILEK